MKKETVIIEIIDKENPEVVSVIGYDKETESIIPPPIETMSKLEALISYNVIGEMINSEIKLF